MGGSGWGIHVNPWLIHVNVGQKPLKKKKVMPTQKLYTNVHNSFIHKVKVKVKKKIIISVSQEIL